MATDSEIVVKIGSDIGDLKTGLAQASTHIDNLTKEVENFSKETEKNFGEAKGSIALLGDLIGVHLPRHVRSFIAELPGVAPAMELAFTGLAISVFAQKIFETIEHFKKLKEAAEKAHDGIQDSIFGVFSKTEELDLKTLEAQDHISKLLGKPATNGLVEEIVRTAKEVNELAKTFDTLIAKESQALIESSVGRIRGTLTGQAASEEDAGVLKEAAEKYREADNEFRAAYNEAYAKHREDIIHGSKAQKEAAAHAIAEETQSEKEERDKAFEELKNKSHEQLEKIKRDEAASSQARFEARRNVTDETGNPIAVDEVALKKETDEQAADEYAPKKRAFKDFHALVTAGELEMAAQHDNIVTEHNEKDVKASAEAAKKQDEINKKATEAFVHALHERSKIAEIQQQIADGNYKPKNTSPFSHPEAKGNSGFELIKANNELAASEKKRLETIEEIGRVQDERAEKQQLEGIQSKALAEQDEIKAQTASGHLTKTQELTQLTASIERQRSAELDLINPKLEEQKNKIEDLNKAIGPAGLAGASTEQLKSFKQALAEYQHFLDQKQALTKRSDAEIARLDEEERRRKAKIYQDIGNSLVNLTGVFNQNILQWANGQQSFGQAVEKSWTGIANAGISALLRLAEQELIGALVHQNIANQEKLTAAKTAASNTYASVSGVPIIGPVLAPVAAGAAFAAVEAFEHGGLHEQTGIALMHKKEMTLPAHLSEFVQGAAAKASSGGSEGAGRGVTVNYQPHINTLSSAGMSDALDKHGAQIISYAKKYGRQTNTTR